MDRWVCTECREVTEEPLAGRNPFNRHEMIIGCPTCRGVNTLVTACWKCDRESSCGMPTEEHGYVWSCHEHRPTTPEPGQ